MLFGTYEHNLDAKNRLFVPADFKELIEGKLTIRLNLSKHPHIDCFLEKDFEDITADEITTITADDIIIPETKKCEKRRIGF
jgi:DNA-binding transcriptional regulator/RsmH inhibitor MraZ